MSKRNIFAQLIGISYESRVAWHFFYQVSKQCLAFIVGQGDIPSNRGHKSMIFNQILFFNHSSVFIAERSFYLHASSTHAHLYKISKKIFRSVSAAAIKQLQAKQKYGLAFYQPNLHFVKKKFCVSSMQFTKFDYERKVGHKYLSVCSYGGTHKKVSEERDKSKS